MNLLISKLISSILQIIIFAFIPFVWWLITAKKKESFFTWIGIKKVVANEKTSVWRITLIITIGFMLISLLVLSFLKGTETATSDFAGVGIIGLPASIIYAFFNTALPEEIIFRGFLLKQLKCKLGLTAANLLQSILFGMLHGIMFISLVGVLKAILIIIFTGAIAWFMGYVNEKKANGSIYPSWMIHGVSNTFSALISMFSII